MAFRASAGRITVTNDDDTETVFDSNEGLLGSLFVAGQITLPERQATSTNTSYSPIDVDTDHVVATGFPTSYDTVVGAIKVTTPDAVGINNLGWFNANGSYMHAVNATSPPNIGSSDNWNVSSMTTYTFKVVSGTLYCNERSVLVAQPITGNPNTITFKLFAVQMDYRLFVGRFV